MYISDDDKKRIINGAAGKLHEYIADFIQLRKSGKDLTGKCPRCGKEKKFTVSPAKQVFKCFSCDWGGNTMVTFLMEGYGKSYVESLQYLAEKQNIFLVDDVKPKPNKKNRFDGNAPATFCDMQLAGSGLKYDDVRIPCISGDANHTVTHISPFQKGGIDQYGRIDSNIDDMIIWYYDLDGNQVTWRNEKKNKEEPFFRVRFANPAIHIDKDGKPMKYRSPYGSGTHIYIPEKIRELYRHRRPIHRLYLQEGEKKAEKACKHGLPSVGLMGIHSIASRGHLPVDLQRIVQTLEVKEVVFVFDSDWDKISDNIKVGDQVDKRPRTFFYAVRNFRDYFKTFVNIGIYVECYFAHIIANKNNDKGIDDLLVNTLNQKEEQLKADIEAQVNSKDGKGQYIQLYKISTWTDFKLEELWGLQNAQVFADRHKALLEKIPEFRIGKHRWRYRNGEFESAQPLSEDEQFWEKEEWEDKSGRKRINLTFNYVRCFNFLANRGFGRIKMVDGEPHLAFVNGKIVTNVQPYEIKDFVTDFTKQIAEESVLNMIYRGGSQYLGPQRMQELDFVNPIFEKPCKNKQYLYFKGNNDINVWEILPDGIKQKPIQELEHYVWSDTISQFEAKLLEKPLLTVDRFDIDFINRLPENERDRFKPLENKFDVEISEIGTKCHFLMFLYNASNFYWRKQVKNEPLTIDEISENTEHLMAKLTAIGYLLHSYKDSSVSKAVILMDGRQSEVGTSNGRTGKSLMGKAIEHVIPQHYIGAKGKNLTDDVFLFDGLTEKHRNLFLDDVRANIDFEFFFPLITGKLMVNQKGGRRFTLPFEQTPKLLISTNHAINGEGSSFQDRQWLVAFSDFYNDDHKPLDDFGVAFFTDWDYEQWNLFYNLMATCIQLYLKYGVVESPNERLEKRRLRQNMGEDFLVWAEEYYAEDGININKRRERKEVYEAFLSEFPHLRKYITPTSFKRKLRNFCEWKGYRFNPQRYNPFSGEPLYFDKDGRPDVDDKTGGKEYFTIGNQFFNINNYDDTII